MDLSFLWKGRVITVYPCTAWGWLLSFGEWFVNDPGACSHPQWCHLMQRSPYATCPQQGMEPQGTRDILWEEGNINNNKRDSYVMRIFTSQSRFVPLLRAAICGDVTWRTIMLSIHLYFFLLCFIFNCKPFHILGTCIFWLFKCS